LQRGKRKLEGKDEKDKKKKGTRVHRRRNRPKESPELPGKSTWGFPRGYRRKKKGGKFLKKKPTVRRGCAENLKKEEITGLGTWGQLRGGKKTRKGCLKD